MLKKYSDFGGGKKKNSDSEVLLNSGKKNSSFARQKNKYSKILNEKKTKPHKLNGQSLITAYYSHVNFSKVYFVSIKSWIYMTGSTIGAGTAYLSPLVFSGVRLLDL